MKLAFGRALVLALLVSTNVPAQPAEPDFGRLVDDAFAHFKQAEYREARAAFDRALPLAESDDERATLTFNAAVAAYELGDYLDAEQRFVASAEFAPATRSSCQVYAGLAALGAGSLERARAHLASADPADSASQQKRRELEQAIVTTERAAERAKHERATKYLSLGRRARREGHHQQARAYFEAALREEPAAADVLVALGDTAVDQNQPELAEQYYTRALAPLSKPDERAIVRQRIDALYPLPASGPELRAEVTAGFDSNASQSGAANAVGASGTADQSSALTRLSLGLGWTVRTGRNTALTPAYAGSSLLLWQPEVQDLSLHGQELGLAFDWAPTHRLALRLSASAPLYLIGLNEPEPFSFEPGGSARLAVTHDQTMTTRLFLDARLLQGLNGRDALSGHRFELGARETASLGRGALWAEASAGENGMGVSEVGTSPDDFAICSDVLRGPGAACGEGSVYLIPLGYRFIGASLGTSTTPLSSLTFSASARVEYRRYLQDSVLLLDPFGLGPYGAPAEYRRLREDVRVAASLRAALALDEAEHYSLLGSYSLLLSTSNIAQNEGGREHALDYDDRNFTQHVVELGLAAHLW